MSSKISKALVPHTSQFNNLPTQELLARKFVLTLTGTISSDGSGTISQALTMDPSGANDWGLISNYYDEFRVIGVRIKLVSLQQFSVTAKNALLCAVFDNDSSSLLTFTTATQYANKVYIPAVFTHNNGRVWTHTFQRPSSLSSPIPWVDVGTSSGSAGSFQIVSAAAALSVSTNYYNYAIEWMIEARGRR